MQDPVIIGVDGGGTKSVGAAVSASGEVLAIRRGGGINYNNIGLEAARKNLYEIVSGLINDCGRDYSALYIGSAAIETPAGRDTVEAMAGKLMRPEAMVMESDAYMALMGMTQGGPGLIVICGTGSMLVMDDGIHGQQIMGGWGHILGDPGSGYTIAAEGLRSAIRCWEETGPETTLAAEAVRYFSLKNPRRLTDKIYDPTCGVDVIARFAENVFKAADAGDRIACEIIKNQMHEIASEAAALLKKSASVDQVGLYGGIFQHQPMARRQFADALQNKLPNRHFNFINPEFPPELGAVILYFRQHEQLNGELLDRMKKSYDFISGKKVQDADA